MKDSSVENGSRSSGTETAKRAQEYPAAAVPLKTYALGLAALWTLVLGALMWVNWFDARQQMLALAQAEARGLFDRYSLFMQPAFMTERLHRAMGEKRGASAHITSLKPADPENAPDAWETASLHTFEEGTRESMFVEDGAGTPTLHYMAPVIVEESCLPCHGKDGYKLGDVRGGISVSVGLLPYLAAMRSRLAVEGLGYALLWIVGLCGIGIGARDIGKRVAHIKTLQGILPICMHCHRIRDDQESWHKLEEYLQAHTEAQFSHGLCAECLAKHYPGYLAGEAPPGGEDQ